MLRFNPIDIARRRLDRIGKHIFREVKEFYSEFISSVNEEETENSYFGSFRVQDSRFCFYVLSSDDFVDHLQVRQMITNCDYSVIFILYASESLIRFVLNNPDSTCLFVYSLRKCFGCGGKFGSFVFESIKKSLVGVTLGANVVEGGVALRYFEQYNLLEQIFNSVWRRYVALGFGSSVTFLCRFWVYLKRLLASSVGEVTINDSIISFLRYLGFKVFDFSNTPGNADIVVGYPFPLIVEVKKDKAVERDLDQVIRYINLYRYAHERTRHLDLDWRAILVAKNFSSGLKILAAKENVSLLTFHGFFRFVVLLSALGTTKRTIMRILAGGPIGEKVIKAYRARLRELLNADVSKLGNVLLINDEGKPNELFVIYGLRLLNLLFRVVRNEKIPGCIKIRF